MIKIKNKSSYRRSTVKVAGDELFGSVNSAPYAQSDPAPRAVVREYDAQPPGMFPVAVLKFSFRSSCN